MSVYNRPYHNTPSFQCTYGSASNQTANAQYGVGGALGFAFQEISKANNNWNNARDNAMASGNHWALPNGTHNYGNGKIVKSNSCIRYEPANGHCSGITSDGIPYSYTQ